MLSPQNNSDVKGGDTYGKPTRPPQARAFLQPRCSYCGDILRRRKYYSVVWPELGMCARCKDSLPNCHVCHRKAVDSPFMRDKPRADCNLVSHFSQERDSNSRAGGRKLLTNAGGLNLCGDCAGLDPVLTRSQVSRLVTEAATILHVDAGIRFDDTGALSCLPAMRRELAGSVNMRSGTEKDCPFPFPIEAADFQSLTRVASAHGDVSFGRCDTLKITLRVPTGTHAPDEGPTTEVRAVKRVLVARGLPESVFLAHLVHELLHAFLWCSRKGNNKPIHLALEEGVCNALTARVLQRRQGVLAAQERGLKNLPETSKTILGKTGLPVVSEVPCRPECSAAVKDSPAGGTSQLPGLAFSACSQSMCPEVAHEMRVVDIRLRLMETHRDEIYGQGYRIVRDVVKRLGLREALRLVREEGGSIEEFKRAAVGVAEAQELGIPASAHGFARNLTRVSESGDTQSSCLDRRCRLG